MSTRGAVRAAQRAYDEQGIRGDYVTVSRDHYTVVGRGRDGHTAITDVPRTGRVHDAVTQVGESLDSMFAAFRLGTRNTNQPGKGRDSMTFPQRSQITEMRGGQEPLTLELPTSANLRDVAPRKRKPEPSTALEPEAELLAHLDAMGAALLREFPEFAAKAVSFDAQVRKLVQDRRKSTLSEGRDEYDALTAQGREKLGEIEKLEAERDGLRMERNRQIAAANAANIKFQSVKRAKPADENFPSRQEVERWQTQLAEARGEVDRAQRPVDDLQGQIRGLTARIGIAKSELRSIRARRDTARERAGIAAPAPSQEADSEVESLRVG